MKAKSLAVKAALGTALAAMTVLAPTADAQTVKTTSDSCTAAGSFHGSVSLTYETTGGHQNPIGATVASGPYIGDSGTLTLKVFYVQDGATTTTFTRIWRGTIPGRLNVVMPKDAQTPEAAKSYISAAFSGTTGSLCTAKAEIK